MVPNGHDERAPRSALLAGALAYLIWGLLPIYLKGLSHLPPSDVLAVRILWSVALCTAIALAWRLLPETIEVLRDGRRLAALAFSALLIGVNWLTYIWAVSNRHIVDASLGYFINPLLSVALGVTLLGERLSRAGWCAVALAAFGVGILTAERGALPWISLVLALSFAIYGLVRKQVVVRPVTGILVETLILLPPALLWLAMARRTPVLGNGLVVDVLLVSSGPLTVAPLILFAFAARRLPLSTVGLMQYAAPTMIFLLGVFLYREPLSLPQLSAFCFIWAGVALYAGDILRRARADARALAQPRTLR